MVLLRNLSCVQYRYEIECAYHYQLLLVTSAVTVYIAVSFHIAHYIAVTVT